MKWRSAVSTRIQGAEALAEVVARLNGPTPDLVLLFLTHHHQKSAEELLRKIQSAYPGARIFGCAGGGVVGGGREVEEGPGLSLTLAQLPDVEIESWHLGEGTDLSAWEGLIPEQDPAILVLADPTTLPVDALLRSLDRRWPNCPKVGGLASGGQAPGENLLFLDGVVHRDGAVVLSLWGDIQLRSVVAQGARPLTEPMTVTRGHYTRIYELDGKPVVQVLEELFGRLSEEERELFRGAPLVGLSSVETPRRGDWLVRNLTG
ncbi:MAG TPA: FIST N-terminal domain-containing protein, partial [Myxococcota bacterium]|nr:FIST N-terminal domain-containing protein [Myxococcota bacterium]